MFAPPLLFSCQNLSSLDLQACSRVSSEALVDLLEGLPCLAKLNLAETQCNTQVLSAVGSCCRRLRELDVSECKKLSPASLLHLAYDPSAGALCCPALQVLSADGLEPSAHSQDLVRTLAFLLLALPSLTSLLHHLVAEAVSLLPNWQWDGAELAPGFPSLKELAQGRMSTPRAEESPRLKLLLLLPLKRMAEVEEPLLPLVCSVCPLLADVAVCLGDGPGLSPSLLQWRHLTHLTMLCSASRALGELLPLTACLGAQLQFLSLQRFLLQDARSFHTLLNHCPNLRKFSASLLPPTMGEPYGEEPLDWDCGLPAQEEFSQLRVFNLLFCNIASPLPSKHAAVVRASLVSLLRHSRSLESLDLVCMPFSLDGVFEEVWEPLLGNPLAHLQELSLAQSHVSAHTIHRLLSSDNQLNYLNLDGCPDIYLRDYDQLVRRVRKEGLEVHIIWG